MDRFVELDPEGGFRSVVQQIWSRSVPTSNGATMLALLYGRNGMKPVYGRKRLSTDAGAPVTWMDRFVEMEPEGGFRAVVQLAQNQHGRNGS
jgi:hypothetical protein